MVVMMMGWALSAAAAADVPAPAQQVLDRLEAPSTPGGFRIVALSNLAEGCVNRWLDGEFGQPAALACTDAAATAALSPAARPSSGEPAVLGEHGLYLTHLSITLAARRRAGGDSRHDALHGRVIAHLMARSMADPHRHMSSFPDTPARWPADQSATLYAAWLYDRLHDTALSAEPIAAWTTFMASEQGTDAELGLHRSEVAGAMTYGPLPRGCAMSWTVRYMSAFDPEGAAALWAPYREHFASDWGLLGFREWPPGVDGVSDIDSGPIIFGVGASATAFAVGASRAVGDMRTHHRLVRTAETIRGMTRAAPELGDVADSALALAIEWNTQSTRPWW